jgi:hypothetical protein
MRPPSSSHPAGILTPERTQKRPAVNHRAAASARESVIDPGDPAIYSISLVMQRTRTLEEAEAVATFLNDHVDEFAIQDISG